MYSYVVLEIAVQIVSLKCTDYQQQQENICTWYLSTNREVRRIIGHAN